MIQLKDVLHYYLGGPCMTPDGYGWITSIDEFGGVQVKLKDRHELLYYSFERIKPILRDIEDDLTEEEMKEYEALQAQHGIHIITNYDTPESFHYLLKKQFDLFNLINSDQALDAKLYNK